MPSILSLLLQDVRAENAITFHFTNHSWFIVEKAINQKP